MYSQWYRVRTLFMGPELLKMSNNHLFVLGALFLLKY